MHGWARKPPALLYDRTDVADTMSNIGPSHLAGQSRLLRLPLPRSEPVFAVCLLLAPLDAKRLP